MIDTIINCALSYVGTTEYPPNSNNVIFNTDYYGHPVNGESYSWCCTFVWYIFKKCNLSNLFYDGHKVAYVPELYSWAKDNNLLIPITDGKRGDIILFDWNSNTIPDHVGIIKDRAYNGYLTIEGNTSLTSQDNGGKVMQRGRASHIFAIIRPKYEKINDRPMEVLPTMPIIKRGDHNLAVAIWQLLLGFKGNDIDGDFGPQTEAMTIKFQRDHNLPAYGVVDMYNWREGYKSHGYY